MEQDTVPLRHTWTDAWVGESEKVLGIIGVWSAKSFIGRLPGEALVNGDQPFEEITGAGPTQKMQSINPTSQTFINTTFLAPSLTKAVRWDSAGDAGNNGMLMSAALGATPRAGIILMYCSTGSVSGSYRSQRFFQTGSWVGGNNGSNILIYNVGYTGGNDLTAAGGSLVTSSGLDGTPPSWYTFAWWEEGGNLNGAISEVGGAFGGIGTPTVQAPTWDPGTGLAFVSYAGGVWPGWSDRRFCAFSLFTAATSAEMAAIHGSVS